MGLRPLARRSAARGHPTRPLAIRGRVVIKIDSRNDLSRKPRCDGPNNAPI